MPRATYSYVGLRCLVEFLAEFRISFQGFHYLAQISFIFKRCLHICCGWGAAGILLLLLFFVLRHRQGGHQIYTYGKRQHDICQRSFHFRTCYVYEDLINITGILTMEQLCKQILKNIECILTCPPLTVLWSCFVSESCQTCELFRNIC